MRDFQRPTFILSLGAAACATASVHAGIVSTWVGRSGTWNLVSNWSDGIPGTAGVTDAVISTSRGTLTVNLDTSPSLGVLTIGAGCTLVQPNNRSVALTQLVNDGVWAASSVGNFTDIQINGAVTSFSGTGILQLNGGLNVRVYGFGGLRTIANGAGHTVAGVGQLGLNLNLLMQNAGTIAANLPGGVLTVDLTDGVGNSNNGVLLATNGGTLALQGTTWDNAGGVLLADEGSDVQIGQGTTIVGGALNNTGTGTVHTVEGNQSIVGVTNLGTFTLRNNDDINVYGTILNQGTISMQSVGNFTDVRIDSSNDSATTLAGGGELVMGGHLNNRIYGINGLRRLVNGPDHTIRGGGQFGINLNLVLTNQGVIVADNPTSPLTIDLIESDNQNDAELQAHNGKLVIYATPLDNGDGVLRAKAGGEIEISTGTTIYGGVLVTEGDGVLHTIEGNQSIVGVTNLGTFTLRNNDDINVYGTIQNQGTISMESLGNFTDFRIDSTDGSPTTLAGDGELVLGGHLNNRIYGINGLRRLVNGPDHTIRGGGQFGINLNLVLTNQGVIVADNPTSPLTIDLIDGDNQNDAELQAHNGKLVIHATPLDNGDGVLRAKAGGEIEISTGTTIYGGVLVTEGDGKVHSIEGNQSIVGVTNLGTFTLRNNDDINVYGTIQNQGTISMESVGNFTDLRIDTLDGTPTTLAGDGELVLGGNANNRLYGINGVREIVNGSQHTIRGGGQIGVNSNLNLTNHGTLLADGPLTIDITNAFVNDGTFRVTGAGSATIGDGAFINEGAFIVEATRTATRSGSMNQQDGQTRVDGTLTMSPGASVLCSGGLVSGDGTINGKVEISGGSASPSNADGSDLGSLVVNGSYAQSNDGGYVVDLGLAGNDHLQVNGAVALGGALQVRLVGAFVPMPGQEFTILNATSINGVFGCVEFPNAPAGYFTVVYGPVAA